VRLAIIALILAFGTGAFLFMARTPFDPPTAANDDGWAALIQVIDGDTLDVALGGTTVRIRLFGADAPERDHPCYASATSHLRAVIGLGGGRVQLEPGPRAKDPNDRTLAYVWVEADGNLHLVDEALVQVGEAEAWRRDGQHRERIISAEIDARETRQGCLWR
jgi:endonuclease YncB( thermonuclease family)